MAFEDLEDAKRCARRTRSCCTAHAPLNRTPHEAVSPQDRCSVILPPARLPAARLAGAVCEGLVGDSALRQVSLYWKPKKTL